jgi:hypothetical protein
LQPHGFFLLEIDMKFSSLIWAAGTGALLVYFLDPEQGRPRRIRFADQARSRLRRIEHAASVITIDIRNRLRGGIAAFRQQVAREPVLDAVLTDRVRARIGRAVSHPGAIEVVASDGVVILSGNVLEQELQQLVREVGRVPGVVTVDCLVQPHADPRGVPSLQGPVRQARRGLAESNWPPSTRFLAGLGGALLLWRGLARRSLTAPGYLAGGALLVACALDGNRGSQINRAYLGTGTSAHEASESPASVA